MKNACSVEASNAEFRYYLARLARKSRCFSRYSEALRRALKFFIYAWNRRQLHRRRFPKYEAHVRDFVSPRFYPHPFLELGLDRV